MRVVSLVKNIDGCTFHRVYMPNKYIDAEVRTLVNVQEEDMEWCDLLIYSRHYIVSPKFLNEMKEKHNVKIVVDTDDSIDLHKNHPNFNYFSKTDTTLQIKQHIMYADAVTVTHERLADEIRKLNPNVYIIPNGIAYGEGQFVFKPQEPSDRLRLLYASSVLNYSNTEMLRGVFEGMNVEFVLAANDGSKFFTEIVKNLTGNVLPYTSHKWKGVDEYMSAYEGDVLIVPNKSMYFNSMKSNLKILEAAVLKIPVIVSRTHPYIDEDFPVIYANSAKEWRCAVERLMDPTERKRLGEELYDYCKERYDLKVLAKKRLQVYQDILSK